MGCCNNHRRNIDHVKFLGRFTILQFMLILGGSALAITFVLSFFVN